MPWCADFETTTDPADCRVWAWAVCNIEDPDELHMGNRIEGFLDFIEKNPDDYWFHNLGFDVEFVYHYILTNGWGYDKHLRRSRTFNSLISAQGKHYQAKLCFEKRGKKKKVIATLKDSYKKLTFSVENVAKSFNLPINKLSIDYKAYRAPGHELTEEERAYLANDVRIMALAMRIQFAEGLDHLTIGADALASYKSEQEHWADLFPTLPLEMDEIIRRAYRGGWTYANPKHQATAKRPGKTVGEGCSFDVNSLYPSVMYNRMLPIGAPLLFEGEYSDDELYPLYIQFLTLHAKLKPDHLPTFQVKGNPYYSEREYIVETDGYVECAVTNIDLALMREHYELDVLSYDGGVKFRQGRGMFCRYIDHWMKRKATTTGGQRVIAKLMLNSLYGKFATNPDVTGRTPYLKEDGAVGYKLNDIEYREPVYTAAGVFITSYARDVTIRAAQRNYDRFLYADTDSIHLLATQPPEGIEVHPSKLGAWKQETIFSSAKYLRAKAYAERITHVGTSGPDGEMYMQRVDPFLDVKCAGLPKDARGSITMRDFRMGAVFPGKLRPVHVPGGIVFEDVDFTIKSTVF